MNTHKKFYGLTTALATPLTAEKKFDEKSMKKLVDYTIDSGVSALLTLGVAGEAMTFERDIRKDIINKVKEFSRNRVPIIAGVLDSGTDLVLQNIWDAKEAGADYVMATPPNFYMLTQEEMRNFFLEIADKGGLPVIAYNCSWVKNHLAPETVAELAAHNNMAALKETSDMVTLQRMHAILKDREDFILMSGEEYLFLPAIALGIKAFVMGGPGNVLPKYCLNIIKDYNSGKTSEAAKKHNNMFEFLYELYQMRILDMATIKVILEIQGLCSRYVSKPFENPTDEEVMQIKNMMTKYGIEFN